MKNKMNKIIAGIGALIVTVSVILFAISMLISFNFGSYFVCMLLPIGYIDASIIIMRCWTRFFESGVFAFLSSTPWVLWQNADAFIQI